MHCIFDIMYCEYHEICLRNYEIIFTKLTIAQMINVKSISKI